MNLFHPEVNVYGLLVVTIMIAQPCNRQAIWANTFDQAPLLFKT